MLLFLHSSDKFVKSTKKKGLLPKVLENLLIARGKAKKLMGTETDPMKYAVYNGRQLALKVQSEENSFHFHVSFICDETPDCHVISTP